MEISEELKSDVLKYLEGNMDKEQEALLEEALVKEGYSLAELVEMEFFLKKMDEQKIPEFPQRLNDAFYSMLYQQQEESKGGLFSVVQNLYNSFFTRQNALKLAFGITLLTIGFIGGLQLNSGKEFKQQISVMNDEMHHLKKMLMLTLLEQESAIERLQAVNMSETISNQDDEVIKALLSTLNNDENVNVRLVALDALHKMANNPEVRKGLVQSIINQTSPLVQITLAEIMVQLHEKSSAPSLKKLLEDNNLNQDVKKKLEESIETLL